MGFYLRGFSYLAGGVLTLAVLPNIMGDTGQTGWGKFTMTLTLTLLW